MRTLSLQEQRSVSGGYQFSRYEGFVTARADRIGMAGPGVVRQGSVLNAVSTPKGSGFINARRWVLSLF